MSWQPHEGSIMSVVATTRRQDYECHGNQTKAELCVVATTRRQDYECHGNQAKGRITSVMATTRRQDYECYGNQPKSGFSVSWQPHKGNHTKWRSSRRVSAPLNHVKVKELPPSLPSHPPHSQAPASLLSARDGGVVP